MDSLSLAAGQKWKKLKEEKTPELSLKLCLQHYAMRETLDADNLWYCSSCKTHVAASKKMDLYRLPKILVILLKRFKNRNLVVTEKISTFVDFPLEGLDMSPYVLGTASLPARSR